MIAGRHDPLVMPFRVVRNGLAFSAVFWILLAALWWLTS
jgi:hypothetical protein